VIECGGDTDTVGAIAGALAGASTGEAGIPADWRSGLRDLPIHAALLRRLAQHLGRIGEPGAPPGHLRFPLGLLSLPRNLFFLAIILYHGLRRLLPPY
jgi:hypothetical protein